MKLTFNDGTMVDVEIIRKNNKNIYFRFKEDLVLYVTAPMFISAKEIQKLLDKNKDALFSMYEKMEARAKDADKFWHLGQKYYIVIDKEVKGVVFAGKNVLVKSREELASFQNSEMLRIYNEEVEMAKKCFVSLPDFTLKTRKMTSRWGVCDIKKKIVTLNTELIKKDIALLDYVIIHELCHFFEPNHSKDFWALVASAYPNYKEARKKLRY